MFLLFYKKTDFMKGMTIMAITQKPAVDSQLHENRTHGSALFSFASYPGYKGTENLLVTYHWHKEVEVICFQNGNATVLLNGKEYQAEAGDIIFVNQGELHQISSDCPDLLYHAFDFLLDSLNFSDKDYVQSHYLTPLTEKAMFFSHFLSHSEETTAPVFNTFLEILDTYEKKAAGYQLLIKASLLKIISMMIENNQLITPEAAGIRVHYERERQLKEILTYIHNNYAQKMHLEDIADTFHMSGKYFSRYFKKHFGYTFVEYLNHFRIEKACVLLVTTDMRIMEISFDTGFENFSYFIRKFKEITGFTPAAYRNYVSEKVK